MIGQAFYTLIRSSGGISLEYQKFLESDFSAANGAVYAPPEEGDFRRIDVSRTIQLLSQAVVVLESFQTTSAFIRLPFSSPIETQDDAGNGRFFCIKNSGTGNITIQDSTGSNLELLKPNTMIVVFGNQDNTWDFLDSRSLLFDNSTNGFTATNIQAAVEEVKGYIPSYGTPVSIGLNNSPGVSPKISREDHVHRIDNLTFTSDSPRTSVIPTTLNGTLVLTNQSNSLNIITGTATGYVIKLPNATTLINGTIGGWMFDIWNTSSQNVVVQYDDGSVLETVLPNYRTLIVLQNNTTTNGVWLYVQSKNNLNQNTVGCISYSRNGGVSAGAYLYIGSTLTSTTGYTINGSNYIDRIAVSNSSLMASGRSATFRLRRRTGINTFVDIPGTDITIPSLAYSAVANNLSVSIGPNWEISCYRISNDGGGGVNDAVFNAFITPQ